MSFWEAITSWKSRVESSDLKRVKVTSSGAFYMKSGDLFNDKEESLELLRKLDRSVNNYQKGSKS